MPDDELAPKLVSLKKGLEPLSGLKDIAPEIGDEEEDSQPDIVIDIEEAQKPKKKSSRLVGDKSKQREEERLRKDQMRKQELREEESLRHEVRMRVEER